jgi:predicted amidophosphoribosyltransferase
MMDMDVFAWLLDAVVPPRESERAVRRATLDELCILMRPFLIESAGVPVTALLPYRSPLVQAAIQEAKFHRNTRATLLLGGVLRDYLLELSSEEAGLSRKVVLIPIPLSQKRRAERGYNQVEKILAAARGADTDVPLDSSLLSRARDTLPQTTLTREARLKNMNNAFVSAPADPSVTYVVIDDVTTTGATLRDAVRALTDAGATHIIPLALAH